MQSVVFNGRVVAEQDFKLDANDRAFRFGDGVFETIRFDSGKALLIYEHLERLALGAEILGMNIQGNVFDTMPGLISQLLSINSCSGGMAKVNIYLWRTGGGMYIPATNEANFLIKAIAIPQLPLLPKIKTVIYEDVRLTFSMISSLKKLNSLPYILAARYAANVQADDCIMTDVLGRPAECSSANLFWIREGILCTPSLISGCVNGAYRRRLIQEFVKEGRPVREELFTMSDLKLADFVFTTNAFGIKIITEIDGRPFASKHPLLPRLMLFD